ncbi:uncharacterized protein [Littorina saxatilis]|uniref:uncharacterized protein n=1 Tax=Littorina saxatilis TaxID=31220 RepID=UPI0038B4597C
MACSRQTHRHRPLLWLNKWLCRLTNENLQALAFFKLRHLHTLVLSRNRNNLTMATLRAIVNNQTSLRYLFVDPFPLLQRKRGDVAEVADIFRTSGLVLLALTRIPQHDTGCLHRVCSYRPCPAPVNNVTLFDVTFHKGAFDCRQYQNGTHSKKQTPPNTIMAEVRVRDSMHHGGTTVARAPGNTGYVRHAATLEVTRDTSDTQQHWM